jgi:uncharacterized membrane protein YeaQ/YmgE (transglycosylase-associated protein family)
MIHFIIFLVTGLVAGIIADQLMGRRHGWLIAMIIGLIGGAIGGFLFNALHVATMMHLPDSGFMHWVLDVVIAVIGAVILLFVLGLFRGGGRQPA